VAYASPFLTAPFKPCVPCSGIRLTEDEALAFTDGCGPLGYSHFSALARPDPQAQSAGSV